MGMRNMCEGWKNEDKRTLRYKLVLPYHFTCVRESSWKMNVYMSSTPIQSHEFFYEKAYVKKHFIRSEAGRKCTVL